MSESLPPRPSGAAPEKSGLIDDLLDVFIAPTKLFSRNLKGRFFAVMMIVSIVSAGLGLVNKGVQYTAMESDYLRTMAATQAETPELTDEIIQMQKPFAIGAQTYGLFVAFPLIIFCVGIMTFLASKIVGADVNFGAALTIGAFAYAPRIIEQVMIAIQGAVLDGANFTSRFQFSIGAARFLPPDGPMGIAGAIARTDLFTIWITVLVGIGIAKIGKVPASKAAVAAIIVWALGMIPVLPALLKGQ
ncbi:MAG: YIP1 family protein [Gemmatimonadaceae bacterium]|nr:YIP1 family protein [Gemmatimonadaceae bacterium]